MEPRQSSEVYEPFLLMRHSSSSRKPLEEDNGLIRRVSSMKPGSVQASFCSLFSSTAGIGFLSIPYATSECGLVLGTLVLVLGGLCFSVYYRALAQACARTGIFSYIGIVDNLYGRGWAYLAEATILTSCFGLLSVMWVIILELCTSLFPFIDSVPERTLLLFSIALLLELPLSIKPEIASLRYAAAFSFICVAFLAGVMCFEAYQVSPSLASLTLFNFSLKSVDSIILVLFAYDATIFIPIIFSEMAYSKRRSYRMMGSVIQQTNAILMIIYVMLGLGGYLARFPNVPELFVIRANESEGVVMHIGKYLVLITVLVEIPLIINPARLTTQQMIGGPAFIYRPEVYYGSTAALTILPIFLALSFRQELTYFKVLGGVCSVCHGFIFPSTRSTELWCTSRCTGPSGRAGRSLVSPWCSVCSGSRASALCGWKEVRSTRVVLSLPLLSAAKYTVWSAQLGMGKLRVGGEFLLESVRVG